MRRIYGLCCCQPPGGNITELFSFREELKPLLVSVVLLLRGMSCCFTRVSNVCCRFADGAGHGYGPTESNFNSEHYGPIYTTGRLLAEAGQPKGKVTNSLLPLLDTCKPPSPPCLHFTSVCFTVIPTGTVPQASFSFTSQGRLFTNTWMSSHVLFLRLVLDIFFPSKEFTTLTIALVIYSFLSCSLLESLYFSLM